MASRSSAAILKVTESPSGEEADAYFSGRLEAGLVKNE